jgi:hypothetical protein
MDISQLLNSDLGKQLISGISGQTGASENETASVVHAAAPALLGMLQKNASSEEGASGILNALNKHDGSILDNLSGFLGGGGDAADGNGILGHILGNKRGAMENALSNQTGVSGSKISGILAMLAPVIMGFLGKQAQTSNVSSGSGLGGLLGGLLGGSAQGSSAGGGILSSLLDQDGDGHLSINDAISAVSGKGSGGLGGILGNLFGKK